jgi:hypothetical protein
MVYLSDQHAGQQELAIGWGEQLHRVARPDCAAGEDAGKHACLVYRVPDIPISFKIKKAIM